MLDFISIISYISIINFKPLNKKVMKLTEEILFDVFKETEEKVVGTSHWGRMVDKLESIGILITESRYRKLNAFLKQMNRGVDLSK